MTRMTAFLPARDLESILPEGLFAELEGQTLPCTDESGQTVRGALSLSGSRYLAGLEDTEPYCLFVPYNAPHPEQIAAFVAYSFMPEAQ